MGTTVLFGQLDYEGPKWQANPRPVTTIIQDDDHANEAADVETAVTAGALLVLIFVSFLMGH
jgi:hypothetical protein